MRREEEDGKDKNTDVGRGFVVFVVVFFFLSYNSLLEKKIKH